MERDRKKIFIEKSFSFYLSETNSVGVERLFSEIHDRFEVANSVGDYKSLLLFKSKIYSKNCKRKF